MRRAAVLLLAIAACSGPVTATRDAADADPTRPDAHPGDARPLVCQAGDGGVPGKPPGATGQLASGAYAITWSPVVGPFDNVNPLLGADRLTVDVTAGTAHYDSTTCAECAFDHHGAAMDGCLLIATGFDGEPSHDPYMLCATGNGGVIAEITWCGYPGPPGARTWRVDGHP